MTKQSLPYAGPSSLGTDRLEVIEHWPEEDYPKAEPLLDPIVMLEEPNDPLQLSLMQALQIGARNSFEYQTRKEDIFKEALDLDLERNDFRNIFVAEVDRLIETDMIKTAPREQIEKMIPMRRVGRPEEVAAVVSFLMGDEASYMTGQAINVTGGEEMR